MYCKKTNCTDIRIENYFCAEWDFIAPIHINISIKIDSAIPITDTNLMIL